jgi:hypothetical protein
MEAFNEQLVERVDKYIEALFTPADDALTANLAPAMLGTLLLFFRVACEHHRLSGPTFSMAFSNHAVSTIPMIFWHSLQTSSVQPFFRSWLMIRPSQSGS